MLRSAAAGVERRSVPSCVFTFVRSIPSEWCFYDGVTGTKKLSANL
jgi:hypothetical protein